MNGTILKCVRCSSSTIDFKTSMEVWSGKPTDYSNLRSPICVTIDDISSPVDVGQQTLPSLDYQLIKERTRRNIVPPKRSGYTDLLCYALN
ncbi:hypothetical protein CR513_14293, partial [Mucuna pruriens]